MGAYCRRVRILVACSALGTGHFLPLVPFLDQWQDGGPGTGGRPPSLEDMVRTAGHSFLAGGEPPKERVRHVLSALELLPVMEWAVRDWRPDVILRDPYEFASASAAARLGVPTAQVAISLAGGVWEMIESVAPELELFLDGVVCHGGSGTTYGTLAVGVPLVVMPLFADQFANARAVARASVGIQVLPNQVSRERQWVRRQDAPRIRTAIETVLANGSYRQAAQAVAAEMAAAPAIGTLLGQLPQRR